MDFVRISPPSAQNVDAEGISNFLQALNNDPQLEAHGLIIHRNGYRIAEGYWAPHQAQDLRLVYSLSKSFSGTALSLMIGEGRLGLDDLVQDYLPEYFETADPAFQNLRIRHLASMASGHDKETNGLARQLEPDDPVKGFLRIPPAAEPGTLFAYNQPPVLALVTILQRLAGQRLLDYLQPRLFEPLGIKDARWAQHQPDIDLGYSGLYINLDAAARLGQLYLEDGVWQGNRLLPEGWVSQASAVQTPNPMNTEPDWQQGYGFQLWRSRHGYRGDGAMGQYMVVLPEQNALIAMFSCLNNMQRVLDLMWEHLLPAMPTTPASLPVSAHDADERLAMQLQQLARPTAAQRLNGTAPIPADQSFTPETAPERLAGKSTHRTITGLRVQAGKLSIEEGSEVTTADLSLNWQRKPDSHIACSATQTADGCLQVDIVLLETPHTLQLCLDPARGTFTSHWPLMPIFSAGPSSRIAQMKKPD